MINNSQYLGKKPLRTLDQKHTEFVIEKNGRKYWRFRARTKDVCIDTKRKISGDLRKDRELFSEWNKQIAQGVDPLKEQKSKVPSFDYCKDRFLAKHLPTLTNVKSRQQWVNTLDTYVSPLIGEMSVNQIATKDILRVLEPIWQNKTETAKRVQARIARVPSWAKASGFLEGSNVAEWKDNLALLLPNPRAIS